ncbi:hypothetical protein chiPu_0031797, partial [Chiloscyllium punctatum]|nr:hypothetical protein [Chiloscyllium punctatum]
MPGRIRRGLRKGRAASCRHTNEQWWLWVLAFARTTVDRPACLRRADVRHEAIELLAQPRTLDRQRTRRVQHFLGGGSGLGRTAVDLGDAGCGFLGALRDVLNAARDFLRCRALLLDRACNVGRDPGDLPDRAADLLDRGNRFLR